MRASVPFFDLTTQEAAATFGALIEILLKCRVGLRIETTKACYDEDVTAYLAGILFDYMDPQYQQAVRSLLFAHDADVFSCATRDRTPYHPYWVYKVNADDRLLDLGIFHPHQERLDAVLSQTKTYYEFAAGYDQKRHGHVTAVSDILEKLARWTERYVAILHYARQEYLHFVETLTADQLREFHHGLAHEVRMQPLKAKHDEFLDAYSIWQRTSTPEATARLLTLLDELRQMDPMFRGPPLSQQAE